MFSAHFVTVKEGPTTCNTQRKGYQAQWVSFDEVKSQPSIKDVLTRYGTRYRRGPTESIHRHALRDSLPQRRTAVSYGFFRQMALRDGRGWPCSSYAVLIAT